MRLKTIFYSAIGCIALILPFSLIPVAESGGASAVDETNASDASSDCHLEDEYDMELVGEAIYGVPDANYIFGHKIMIPHQPYVWNIRGQ